jgi:hypothetical protein
MAGPTAADYTNASRQPRPEAFWSELVHGNDEQAYVIMESAVRAAIERIPLPRFSTKRLIEEIRASADGEAAYQEAIHTLAPDPGTEHMALMVLHGQVIPGLLRRSGVVQFGGFIHGNPAEDDGFAVPSMWSKR